MRHRDCTLTGMSSAVPERMGDPGELDDSVLIARDLIRFDTTNFGGGRSHGESTAAQYVEEILSGYGLNPRIFESEPERTSVVARIPGRDSSKGALVLHGHLDVVPADPEHWSVDPFAGVIADGLLWGRGAVDMKNMDAMILTSIGDLVRSGEAPARDVIVAFFADEEDTGIRGSAFMVDEHPEVFAGATEAISEVGGYSIDLDGRRAYLLQTGEKALVWGRLTARGDAAHGSRYVGDTAVTKLARAVTAIGSHNWPIRLTATTRQLVAELSTLLGVDPTRCGPDEVVLRTGSAAGFISASLRTTSNPTVLEAGYKHNVIPETASALIDIRPLPGEEDLVVAAVREIIGDEVEFEVVQRDRGLESPFNGELVTTMIASLNKHDPGAPVLPYLMPGGTDNKALNKLGISGYGFAPLRLSGGLDFPAMFHGVDERVPLDALTFGRAVLGDLLRSL